MDVVIFGITGDLASKKIIPALEHLKETNKLFKDARIIGFARSKNEHVSVLGNYNSSHDVAKLLPYLRRGAKTLFYFAVPPGVYEDLLLSLYRSGVVKKGEHNKKILIEKPFGLSKEGATKLFEIIDDNFDPSQIYALDHYGGKKEIREFASHPKGIDKLSVGIFESHDVAGRAGFYDTVGAINDIGQNHLLYMLAVSLNKHNRTDIIKNLVLQKGSVVTGQYEGYVNEKGVALDSQTETFFRAKFRLDLEGYEGLDIVMSGGKALQVGGSFINSTKLSSGTLAYENIFIDAVNSRVDNFLSEEEIMACWDVAEKIKEEASKQKLNIYKKGSLPEEIGMV